MSRVVVRVSLLVALLGFTRLGGAGGGQTSAGWVGWYEW